MSDSSDSEREEESIHQLAKKEADNEEVEKDNEVTQSFNELGLVEPLCEAAASLGWAKPSKIQVLHVSRVPRCKHLFTSKKETVNIVFLG